MDTREWRARALMIAVSTLAATACGHSSPGAAHGTARVLNGATPGSLAAAINPPARSNAATASDGTWAISPNKLRLTLESIDFQSAFQGSGDGGGAVERATLSGCKVTYDRGQPGLSRLLDCPFTLKAGTYASAFATFNPTYEILIDDSTNGIFTDPASPTKLSRTAPAGGAQFITVTADFGVHGVGFFDPPLVAKASAALGDAGLADDVTVSVVVDGLQFFQAYLSGATATIGVDGTGNVKAPGAVLAVGRRRPSASMPTRCSAPPAATTPAPSAIPPLESARGSWRSS